MIDYELFCKMKLAIESQYKNDRQVFSESSDKTYPTGLQWDGYGVKIISSSFTVAVVCEYDENSPNDKVYVGVKVLDGNQTDGQRLRKHLLTIHTNMLTRPYQTGANGRIFFWACWQTIPDEQHGFQLFNNLVNDCDAYLQSVI